MIGPMPRGTFAPAPWMVDALCVTLDPEGFFPGDGDREGARSAKAVCRQCPVRIACLDLALANNEPHGIWGGKSPNQRHRMMRQAVPC